MNTIFENPIKARPIVPWIGGKRRLAKHLLPLFPEHECYVEPFCGAAALFFMKAPAKTEVLNDINGDLVNLYRVVQHHLEEFVRQFKWALVSRQIWTWLDATPVDTLTDIQRAARFFYLQKLGFGGKVDGRTFGTATTGAVRLNLLRLEEDLSAAHLRLSRCCIEHLEWTAVWSATTGPTRCSTAIRRTGALKDMGCISASTSTPGWRAWPNPSRAA